MNKIITDELIEKVVKQVSERTIFHNEGDGHFPENFAELFTLNFFEQLKKTNIELFLSNVIINHIESFMIKDGNAKVTKAPMSFRDIYK